ncbi:helix-turn-helix domain-containing protein [Streptacidiphilus sp. PB12-B1b]|uniref:GlxA family transcriptional regulator n=1 Tax=Streptacidiphilus sp. PB12-B1b TaxID=2705012 RepID=UPI0015FC5E98|nr:helix-turn-helix domain-containing protein [Streptacidiphilus sp. PB12-B1b]QMU78350.1 helix-turn-helix domain-containing protein [Streptacidiphilus sp. PB12-B1b]
MRIAVLVLDGVFDSGLASVLDVLQWANELREQVPQPPPAWQVTMVGFSSTVRTGAGHAVEAAPVDRAAQCDLLLVPAVAERRPEALVGYVSGPAAAPARELLVDARAKGTQVASACAGTFLFAEAGILNGLRATTTWWLSPLFRSRYPQVALDQSRMVTSCEGVTTAGAAFGHVDLALSIVRRRSPALSDLVGNYLVIDERPSQAAHTMTGTLAASDPTVAAFERWAREHLHEPLSVKDAAGALGISERTLQRTTRAVLGTSPVRFVQDLRIEQATHLLRSTNHSIEAISRRVGYENANTLRILLRERTGTTAGHHRRGGDSASGAGSTGRTTGVAG